MEWHCGGGKCIVEFFLSGPLSLSVVEFDKGSLVVHCLLDVLACTLGPLIESSIQSSPNNFCNFGRDEKIVG